jgi:hypothetical protein
MFQYIEQVDIMINCSSYHPYEHKVSSLLFTKRLQTFPLATEAKETEVNAISVPVATEVKKQK